MCFFGVENSSYLTGVDELKGAESALEVGSVGLKVVEGASDGGLKLRGVLARGAVGRDLVELRGRHFGDCRYRVDRSVVVDCKSLEESGRDDGLALRKVEWVPICGAAPRTRARKPSAYRW